MPDHDALIARLDALSAPRPSPLPQVVRTRVRRRRRVRRARQATGVLLVLLALTPLVWALRSGPQVPPIVEHPDVLPPDAPRREVALDSPGQASLQHLIVLNRGVGADEVVLPESAGGRTPRTLRALDTLKPEAALDLL